jgi:hypothetical protein
MEAAATPFPREETTPPVTKMYFGAVRKSGEILRDNLRTKHYGGIWGECQIANFFWGDLFFGVAAVIGKIRHRVQRGKAENTRKIKAKGKSYRREAVSAEKNRRSGNVDARASWGAASRAPTSRGC